MELYMVCFYDHNESGNVEHNELYATRRAAQNRFITLRNNLNRYSWVGLYNTTIQFGRVRCGDRIAISRSCCGKDNYYHGDGSDF